MSSVLCHLFPLFSNPYHTDTYMIILYETTWNEVTLITYLITPLPIPHHLLNIGIVFDVVCSTLKSISSTFHSRWWSLMYLCGNGSMIKTPEHTTSLWCGMYYLEIHVTSFPIQKTYQISLYETTWNGHTILQSYAMPFHLVWFGTCVIWPRLYVGRYGMQVVPLHARWSF